MEADEVERVASAHLYEGERLAWSGEQRIPRTTPLRLLGAVPGILVIAAVVATAVGLAHDDPSALTGERGLALPGALAAVAAAGAALIWRIAYRPIRAYLGVSRVFAVLTDRRFLWIEQLDDGSTRVRHPFRWAMLTPGDVRSVDFRERPSGAGELTLVDASGTYRENAKIHVGAGGAPVAEVASSLTRVLRVPPAARLAPPAAIAATAHGDDGSGRSIKLT